MCPFKYSRVLALYNKYYIFYVKLYKNTKTNKTIQLTNQRIT